MRKNFRFIREKDETSAHPLENPRELKK